MFFFIAACTIVGVFMTLRIYVTYISYVRHKIYLAQNLAALTEEISNLVKSISSAKKDLYRTKF